MKKYNNNNKNKKQQGEEQEHPWHNYNVKSLFFFTFFPENVKKQGYLSSDASF